MSEPTNQPGRIITGRYCPSCGYDMTGHDSTPQVRCPECGVDHLFNDLRHDPPPHRIIQVLGTVFAVPLARVAVVVVIGLIGVGTILPGLGRTRCGCGGLSWRQSNLRNISAAAFTFSSENNDLMPTHLADLVIDGYIGTDVYVDPELDPTAQQASYFFVDLKKVDYTPEQRALVGAAMELEDPDASYYRFGDVFFPRFPAGWAMSQVSAPENVLHMWTLPNADGERAVAFFDGHIETIEASRWRRVWIRDTQERIRMCVPVLPGEVAPVIRD